MTPPSDHHSCEGCVLQESRQGRVCPAAREVYGLADLVDQFQAEALRVAVMADALSAGPTLPELVRLEAEGQASRWPRPRLLLPAGVTPAVVHDDRKETIHVEVSRSIQ
jgi:hypothetical protein